jgi:hypothetical protein
LAMVVVGVGEEEGREEREEGIRDGTEMGVFGSSGLIERRRGGRARVEVDLRREEGSMPELRS